ncbi:MAG TPA: hypothetical protein VGI81_23450 [Tepidisphaeraceae bacterium]|jgi:hypothetical protein
MKAALSLLLVPILILSFTASAGAKGKKQQEAGGLSGKLVGVSPFMLVLQEKGDANSGTPQQAKIKVDVNTTVEIDGVPGKKLTDLQAGDHVVIQGGTDGPATDVQATTHKGHHKRMWRGVRIGRVFIAR